MLMLFLLRTIVGITILIYSGVLGENILLIKNFVRPTAFYDSTYVLQTIKILFCSFMVIGYNTELAIPNIKSLFTFADFIGIQLFFMIVGFTFLKQSMKRGVVVKNIRSVMTHKHKLSSVIIEKHRRDMAVGAK